MSLFQWGNFTLHSGDKSWWRIDCDSLTDSEIELFAKLIRERNGNFNIATYPKSHPGSCVPKLAAALQKYTEPKFYDNPIILIIDDVLTTGSSMEEVKTLQNKYFQERTMVPEIYGVVLFARGKCPDWITPIFQMPT